MLSLKTNFTLLVIPLLTFLLGWQSSHYFNKSSTNQDLSLFLNAEEMYYGAIKGMVASLGDPFTVFLTPNEHRKFQDALTGTYEGVGIEVAKGYSQKFIIKKVLADSPAQMLGIQSGDLIMEINKQDVQSLDLDRIDKLLNIKEGTKLTLKIVQNSQIREVDIFSKKFVIRTVEYKLLNSSSKKVAYFKVTRFGKNTINEWQDAVKVSLSDKPDGAILDLRDNWGGFNDVPIYIGSEFIERGEIFSEVNRNGDVRKFEVNHKGELLDMPLVILINKGSISSTELLAASLRYHKRAKIVGEKSFGKGTGQEIYPTLNNAGLHVTVVKWLTPEGESIDKIGVKPDVEVHNNDANPDEDMQIIKALEVLN